MSIALWRIRNENPRRPVVVSPPLSSPECSVLAEAAMGRLAFLLATPTLSHAHAKCGTCPALPSSGGRKLGTWPRGGRVDACGIVVYGMGFVPLRGNAEVYKHFVDDGKPVPLKGGVSRTSRLVFDSRGAADTGCKSLSGPLELQENTLTRRRKCAHTCP